VVFFCGMLVGMNKKRLLTGLQSSGKLHIGNYFGALRPAIELFEKYESFLMVADLHALTSVREPELLRQSTIDVVKDYLAAGVNPDEVTLFRQSDVPAHAELAWVLSCLMPVSYLELAHSYKDKVAKGLEANAGLFTYPVLMAADILLYDTDVVPVGKDQQQHIEYAREAAKKFRVAYEGLFTEPQGIFKEDVAVVPGTDGAKMSKSYKNTIPLFASQDEIKKAVMSIVTDSAGDMPINVYSIHRLFKGEAELAKLYEENKGKYGNLKNALIDDIDAYFAAMREKREQITDADVEAVLKKGAEKANKIAEAKLAEVYKVVGLR